MHGLFVTRHEIGFNVDAAEADVKENVLSAARSH